MKNEFRHEFRLQIIIFGDLCDSNQLPITLRRWDGASRLVSGRTVDLSDVLSHPCPIDVVCVLSMSYAARAGFLKNKKSYQKSESLVPSKNQIARIFAC